MTESLEQEAKSYEPRYPALVALSLCAIWIAVLSFPMWRGLFLAGPLSDQFYTGYAWRLWQAEQWKALGHIPLWNPYIFAGLPYVGAFHGDIFYPTAWLRLLLPIHVAMNLGFVVHYILAGFFAYLFIRRLGASWTGAVVGGLGYQLSGVIGSYVQPGHDGKLYVTALLPLVLLSLVMAIRERRYEGYGLMALAIGLAMLSPHPQMTQYMLIAAGLFTLYLAFGEKTERSLPMRFMHVALAFAAVVVGFGIGAIQLLPAFEYIPFSPRAETFRGFEAAATYAIPWHHVPEFLFAGFVGQSGAGTYWGANGIKLHSEYIGLPLVALAFLGIPGQPKRLKLWLGGIGLLFLLLCLGTGTPFFRLWYAVVPLAKQVRAPGMALYIVALVVATFAAFGVQRLERREGKQHVMAWLAVAGGAAVLALAGVVGGVASFLAQGVEQSFGPAAVQILGRSPAQVAIDSASAIRWGAFGSALILGAVGALALAWLNGRVALPALVFGIAALVSADLWWNARNFWTFSDAHRTVHATDQIIETVSQTDAPYRVLRLGESALLYPGSSLQKHNVAQLTGHHANELDRFDKLLDRDNGWRNLGNPNIWDLFAVEYAIIPALRQGNDSIPGYELVLNTEMTSGGVPADLLRRVGGARYARVVPAAVKLSDEQASATVLNPLFSPDQLVLIDSAAPVNPAEIDTLPPELPNAVTFESWEPGHMVVRIDPPAPDDSYLVVSENWYPDWEATIDGEPAAVVRGNVTLITVPLMDGASTVELEFSSSAFRIGKAVTILSALIAMIVVIASVGWRRMGRG